MSELHSKHRKGYRTRRFLFALMRFLFPRLSHLEVQGLQNVPSQGGAILAANHLGRLDSALIFSQIQREDVTGLVADKYKHKFFYHWIVTAVNGIWINRESADLGALREALDYLRKGGLLGIAPEGTRSLTGALILAKTGVAYLADKSSLPVIPIAIFGTEKALRELAHLRRPTIRIQFGEALILPPVNRRQRDADLQHNTDEIMCRIAAMLPPAYRGVYSEHPRLQELLAGIY